MKSNKSWITASDIGKAEYCPNALFLSSTGIRPSRSSRKLMHEGTASHKREAIKATVANHKRCYIATHVYGESHIVTEELRLWRDLCLSKSWIGRTLITVYYAVSPIYICKFGKYDRLNKVAKIFVKVIHKMVV